LSRIKLDAEVKAKLKRDGWARILLPMLPEYCTVLGVTYKECPELWHQLDWSYSYTDGYTGPELGPGEKWEYLHVRAQDVDGYEVLYRVRCFYELGEYIGGKKRGVLVKSVELVRNLENSSWLWVVTIARDLPEKQPK